MYLTKKCRSVFCFKALARRNAFWLLFVYLCSLVPSQSFANSISPCHDGIVEISSLIHHQEIGQCGRTYFDSSSLTNVQDLISDPNFKLKPAQSHAINHGFVAGTQWFQFALENKSEADKKVFLSLGNPLVDLATAYEINSNSEAIKLGEAGVSTPESRKQVADRDVVFSFSVPAGQKKVFLLESKSIQQSYLPVIRNAESFARHQLDEYLIFGIYFGVVAVMALYNFLIYFVVRDKSYLWYAGSILFFHGFCFAGLMGATNHFFWSESPIWAQRHLPAVAPLGLFFALLFANSFLQIQSRSKLNYTLIHALLWIIAAQFVLSAIFFDVMLVVAGFILQIAALSVVLMTAVPSANAGDRSARLFLLAWGFLIVGGLAFSFGQFGIYSHNFFTQHGILFGSAAEVVLLSIALGERINAMRKEKESAQQRALESAQERALLESELVAANAVQETLLPQYPLGKSLDVSTFYRVAERVGGDWFWHTDDAKNGMVYFYVGDVTGHGVPSALLTGVICGAVASMESEYEESPTLVSPRERLLHTAHVINDVVRKTGARSDRWVSMCLLCVDQRSGTLTIVNAGHPFPLIWRTSAQKLESVVASGPLMGHSDARFSVKEELLQEGDFVMIYTDGYLEAKGQLKPEKHSSRRRELIQLFRSSNSPERLIHQVGQEMLDLTNKGRVLTDDVTIVTFRWNGIGSTKTGLGEQTCA